MAAGSILICTRNRTGSLLRAIRSLLDGAAAAFELIVIDQSDGPETEQALEEFRGDVRLRYFRARTHGKGSALNEGLRLAVADIVVCTDDDCEAPPGWPREMVRVMAAHPQAAIVFCNVIAEPHDRASGYVPAYERSSDRVLRSITDAKNGFGLGAGMALRRPAVLAFGGFDETFGPGSRFQSGDDWDISVRALLHGWQVYDTTSVSIVHHGFRTRVEGREHALRDWTAIGALCAKPIRAGHFSAILLALRMFLVGAIWPPVGDLIGLRRPRGLSRIVGFIRGFSAGVRTPVDPKTLLFRASAHRSADEISV